MPLTRELGSEAGFMRRALSLARRGSGFVAPNPLVGAVLVCNSDIVGFGWHRKYGSDHAEIEAISMAGKSARGATLYVNLEPCNHHGNTGPCSEAIIQAGITRVVVATRDPNPNVAGHGIERLARAGILVSEGLLENEAIEVNCAWLHWVTTGKPLLIIKLAVSADGKVSSPEITKNGISSNVSRAQVHRLRRYCDAVMIGGQTVRSDNPLLTNRSGRGRQPLRVIVSSTLDLSLDALVFKNSEATCRFDSPVICFSCSSASKERKRQLEKLGVNVVCCDDGPGNVELSAVIEYLGAMGVQSILCEGGPKLAASLLEKHLVDRFIFYQAPKKIGASGLGFIDGPIEQRAEEWLLFPIGTRFVGPDRRVILVR